MKNAIRRIAPAQIPTHFSEQLQNSLKKLTVLKKERVTLLQRKILLSSKKKNQKTKRFPFENFANSFRRFTLGIRFLVNSFEEKKSNFRSN